MQINGQEIELPSLELDAQLSPAVALDKIEEHLENYQDIYQSFLDQQDRTQEWLDNFDEFKKSIGNIRQTIKNYEKQQNKDSLSEDEKEILNRVLDYGFEQVGMGDDAKPGEYYILRDIPLLFQDTENKSPLERDSVLNFLKELVTETLHQYEINLQERDAIRQELIETGYVSVNITAKIQRWQNTGKIIQKKNSFLLEEIKKYISVTGTDTKEIQDILQQIEGISQNIDTSAAKMESDTSSLNRKQAHENFLKDINTWLEKNKKTLSKKQEEWLTKYREAAKEFVEIFEGQLNCEDIEELTRYIEINQDRFIEIHIRLQALKDNPIRREIFRKFDEYKKDRQYDPLNPTQSLKYRLHDFESSQMRYDQTGILASNFSEKKVNHLGEMFASITVGINSATGALARQRTLKQSKNIGSELLILDITLGLRKILATQKTPTNKTKILNGLELLFSDQLRNSQGFKPLFKVHGLLDTFQSLMEGSASLKSGKEYQDFFTGIFSQLETFEETVRILIESSYKISFSKEEQENFRNQINRLALTKLSQMDSEITERNPVMKQAMNFLITKMIDLPKEKPVHEYVSEIMNSQEFRAQVQHGLLVTDKERLKESSPRARSGFGKRSIAKTSKTEHHDKQSAEILKTAMMQIPTKTAFETLRKKRWVEEIQYYSISNADKTSHKKESESYETDTTVDMEKVAGYEVKFDDGKKTITRDFSKNEMNLHGHYDDPATIERAIEILKLEKTLAVDVTKISKEHQTKLANILIKEGIRVFNGGKEMTAQSTSAALLQKVR